MGSSERFCFLSKFRFVSGVFFSPILSILFLPFISRGDDSIPQYLNKPVTVSCHGVSDLDFAFEFGRLISEWCKKQNEILGEQGCGLGSEMCLEEFIQADRPGNNLYFGVGASYVHDVLKTNGNNLSVGAPFWSHYKSDFYDDGRHSHSVNSTFDRLQIIMSVGVEFPLGSRRTLRKTCVNPYSSDYVSMMAHQAFDSNQAIQSYLNSCSF